MAYDEFLADRIRQNLRERSIAYDEKKMMGGLCFMVDDKMCFGIHINKNSNASLMMARVGPDQYENALAKTYCTEMKFTSRPMKGYVHIQEDGLDLDADLDYWIQLCLAFNPFAKSSKKKTKKIKA